MIYKNISHMNESIDERSYRDRHFNYQNP